MNDINKELYVKCPHCKNVILIMSNEMNCRIFRHGIYKKTGFQMNPHSSKLVCDNAIFKNEIYGCGKPFKLLYLNRYNYFTQICDYI